MSQTDTSAEAVEALAQIMGEQAEMFSSALLEGSEASALLTAKTLRALLAERDALREQLATARNDALEEAANMCIFSSKGLTHYGPEPYEICASNIRTLKQTQENE